MRRNFGTESILLLAHLVGSLTDSQLKCIVTTKFVPKPALAGPELDRLVVELERTHIEASDARDHIKLQEVLISLGTKMSGRASENTRAE